MEIKKAALAPVEAMTNEEKNNGGLIQIKTARRRLPGRKNKLDLNAVRESIDFATAHDAAEKTGPEYWRSLEELAGTPEFQEALHREFPKGASEWLDTVSRRGFLKVMGASLGLAGMTGCVKLPLEPIVPYVRQPEDVIPGRPHYYATAVTLGGYASPVLVESHLGRPTKDRRQRPASRLARRHRHLYPGLAARDVRSRPLADRHLHGRRAIVAGISERDPRPANAQKALQGAGIRILTPTISSPTLADQLRNFLKIYPQAKWHVYEPVNRDNVLEGAKMAFGQPVETRYDFTKADVIVSLDADFLYAGYPGNVKYIRDFASRRNPDSGNMNRLYVIESTPTSTGAKADHRLAGAGMSIDRWFARVAIACVTGTQGQSSRSPVLLTDKVQVSAALEMRPWAPPRCRCVVLAIISRRRVHALAHCINASSAMSARPSSIPTPSMRIRSTKPNR